MGNLDSISGLLLSVSDNTSSLNSNVSRLYTDFYKNFNFTVNSLRKLDINVDKLNSAYGKLKSLNTDGYINYLSEKLISLEIIFKEMFSSSVVSVDSDEINNKIFFNLYDSQNTIIKEKQKFNYNNRLSSVYNFPFNPIELELEAGQYLMTVFYEDENKIYEFDSETDIINFIFSKDELFQRIILDNQKNKISTDLRNFKIYLVDKITNKVKYKQSILNSVITNTELDILCFSLDTDSSNYENYIIIIKEELFDSVSIDLTIGDYSMNDISNIILGNAERDLVTGEFKIYDSFGNLIGVTVSTRAGRKEYRRRIV